MSFLLCSTEKNAVNNNSHNGLRHATDKKRKNGQQPHAPRQAS